MVWDHAAGLMGSSLKVLMMPDFRAGNPYQSLLASALEPLGVTVAFPKGYRRVLPISRAVLQERAQVLHLHWLSPYLRGRNVVSQLFYAGKLWLDLFLVRRRGVRIVWTIHNHVSHEAKFPKIERFIQRCISRLALRIIVHSDSALHRMTGDKMLLGPAPVSVIPHGNYAQAYSAQVPTLEARRELGLATDKILFLYFGFVRPYKNVDGLIAAWRALPELAQRATLIIAGDAGDADYHGYISALAQNVPGLVLRLTRVPDPQVHLYFSAADVVVLPFTRILTSGSLLLAMTFAKPVIAPGLETVLENLSGADDLVYNQNDNQGIQKSLLLAASREANLTGLRKRMEILCAELGWDRIASLTSFAYLN